MHVVEYPALLMVALPLLRSHSRYPYCCRSIYAMTGRPNILSNLEWLRRDVLDI